MRILIVDDNKHNRLILEFWLKDNGFKVGLASDGAEALQKLRKQKFDLIIADILMPVMDGFKLCRKVKSDQGLKGIPFVFYTGTYLDEEDEELALKCGADKFIRKPISEDEFIEAIKDAIEDVKKGKTSFRTLDLDNDEKKILKLHNSRLVRKLEKKVFSLEREVAGRKKVEKEVHRLNQFMESIIDSANVSLVVFDKNLNVMLWNKAAEKASGYTQKEVLGERKVWEWVFPDEKYRSEIIQKAVSIIEGESVENFRTTIRSKDGQEKVVSWNARSFSDEEGRHVGLIAVGRDITDHLKMEEELQKLDKLESVGILAGGLAHDFNNLLTAVLGNISLAKIYSGEEDVTERLSEAEKACVQAKNLTQRLLTLSKGGAFVKETADISDLLKDTAEFALSGSNVRCEFSIPDGLWPVEVDRGQISQVIQNLVTNADQAMPSGGVIRIKAENYISGDFDNLPLRQGRHIKISVSDEGVGIPERFLPKIFDPYFTTKGKSSDKGTGLGLAIAHSIIEKHSGYITVESELGVGTTFCVYFPASPKELSSPEETEEEPCKGEGRILLMDDEEMVRRTADKILNYLGYDVSFAKDGSEAIKRYKEAEESGEPFSVVILDLTVPGGMGGKETLEKLLQTDPKVKAIISSGYSADPEVENYGQYGFSERIVKPYRVKEVGHTLRRVIKLE